YAVDDVAPVDMKETIIDSRLASAGTYTQAADDLKLVVKAAPAFRLGTVAQLRVDVTIDARKLSFAATPDGHVATVDIQIYCGNAKERLVGDVRRRVELRADEETYQRWVREGVPFTTRVPVTDTVTFVKVVA